MPQQPVAVVDPQTLMPTLETRIFAIVQSERHRIDPHSLLLRDDPELAHAARLHSADMAARGYFAHKGPSGESAAELIVDSNAQFQGLVGENLAAQYFTVGAPIDVDMFARRVVDSWLASPGHKENLAFSRYDRTGIGAAANHDTIYVTELFATDLGLPPPPKAAAPAH